MSTEATRQQSLNFGCLVFDKASGAVSHYVEKPSSYISTFINCGVYVCSLDVFQRMATTFHSKQQEYTGLDYFIIKSLLECSYNCDFKSIITQFL